MIGCETAERDVRVAVLVSGGGTNLQALLDAQAAGLLAPGRITLVISNKADAYALTRAQNAGIDTLVFSKKSYGTALEWEDAMLQALSEAGIELIVLAGFMCILTEHFTSKYPERILNVHPALIPSFCGEGMYGLHVHEAALAYGVKVSGATVHFVNEVPDGGKIVAQKAVPVEPDDTPETLQRRIMEQAEWILLPQAVHDVAQAIADNV